MATIAEQLTQLNTDLGTINEEVNTQAELIAQIKLLAEDAEIGGSSSGDVAMVDLATPLVSLEAETGLITATVNQEAGIVEAGTTTTTTYQLPTWAARTITPGTTNKTAVPEGQYTTGAITVKGDTNLVSSNIKNGTSIFGVTGSLVPLKPYLPLAIQGKFSMVSADSWGTGTQFYQHSHFFSQSIGGITYDVNSCTAVASADDQLTYGGGSVTLEVTNNTALNLIAFVTVRSTYLPNASPSSSYSYDYKRVDVPPMTTQGIGFTPTNSAGGSITAATATITGVIWNA